MTAGFKPGTALMPLALRCSVLDHCATQESSASVWLGQKPKRASQGPSLGNTDKVDDPCTTEYYVTFLGSCPTSSTCVQWVPLTSMPSGQGPHLMPPAVSMHVTPMWQGLGSQEVRGGPCMPRWERMIHQPSTK